ncbi:Uncharacterised protein [Halioglobus japonicus]|nr:Uncharacterised protein [Halioglobus japonicus]
MGQPAFLQGGNTVRINGQCATPIEQYPVCDFARNVYFSKRFEPRFY